MLGMACAAALFLLGGEAGDEPLVVRPGEIVSARLEPDAKQPASVGFVTRVPAAGHYTLLVSSTAFDVAVLVGDEGVVSDDDMGPGLDEVIVWSSPAAGTYRFEADGQGATHGEVTIRLIEGRAPLHSWWTLQGELAWFERAVSRGESACAEKLFWRIRDLSRDALLCGDGTIAEKASAMLALSARSDDEKRCAGAVAATIDLARGTMSARDTVAQLLARPDLPVMAFIDAARAAAELRLAVGDVEAARDLLTDVSRRAREAGLQVDEALALTVLGELASEGGSAEEAGDHFESALVLAETFRGPASLTVHCAAGSFFRYSGDTGRARECFDRAAEEAVELAHRLDVESRRCDLDLHTGDFVAAERRIPLIGTVEPLVADEPRLIPILEDLAHLQFRMGRLDESRRLVDVVLNDRTSNEALVNAEALNTLGLIEEASGRLDAAIEVFDAAQRAYDAAGPREREAGLWDRLALQINRGRVLAARGEFERAESEFQSALSISVARDHPLETAAARDGLAAIRRRQGRLEEARALVEPALREYRRDEQRDYLLDSTLLTAARIALDQGRLEECGETLAEAKALLAAADPLAPVTAARLRSRYSNWGELEQDYWSRCSARDPEQATSHTMRGFAAASEWKARALLASIRRSPLDPPRSMESVLRGALASDGALIEFAGGERNLRVYVLHAKSLHVLDLGEKVLLEQSVGNYVDAVFGDSRLETPSEVCEAGHRLFRSILEPALRLLPNEVVRLVVVPNDWLAALPFEALVMAAPEPPPRSFAEVPYVLDRFEVSYAPASQVLARLIVLPPSSASKHALLLADPVFPVERGSGVALRDSERNLQRLPKSRAEALAIADLLLPLDEEGGASDRKELLSLAAQRKRDGVLQSTTVDVFLGSDATIERFLGCDLANYRILHLATHAKADPDDSARSMIWLSAGPDGGHELDLGRIRSLHLDCDLVTLSACETARGRSLKGEGVQSIALAFLECGARAVVASLWNVGDGNAADLMTRFYSNVIRAEAPSPSRALTLAKRELRSDPGQRGVSAIDGSVRIVSSGHPNAWAKFVYVGVVGRKR